MSKYLPIVTVGCEGGHYSLSRNPDALIRIYPNRMIYDGVLGRWRERLSRRRFREVRKYAKENRNSGRV